MRPGRRKARPSALLRSYLDLDGIARVEGWDILLGVHLDGLLHLDVAQLSEHRGRPAHKMGGRGSDSVNRAKMDRRPPIPMDTDIRQPQNRETHFFLGALCLMRLGGERASPPAGLLVGPAVVASVLAHVRGRRALEAPLLHREAMAQEAINTTPPTTC